MPYRRKKRQLRRYKKGAAIAKMAYYGGAGIAYPMIRHALRRVLNVEYKQRYEKITLSATGSTPSFFSLVTLSQGQTQNTRIGAQAKFISIFFNATAIVTTTATFLRFIVLIDKQCNGSNPSGSDLLEDVTINNGIVSPLNMDNKFRFKILYNHVMKLSNNFPIQQIKWYKKLVLPVRYDGTGAAVSALTSNNLLVCVFSDKNGLGDEPLLTWNIKTSYVDN